VRFFALCTGMGFGILEAGKEVRYMLKRKATAPTVSGSVPSVGERLFALRQGFHNNRLEGNPLTEEEQKKLTDWVRQGLSTDEMRALITAEFKNRYPSHG
jgi:hypothetical protein